MFSFKVALAELYPDVTDRFIDVECARWLTLCGDKRKNPAMEQQFKLR